MKQDQSLGCCDRRSACDRSLRTSSAGRDCRDESLSLLVSEVACETSRHFFQPEQGLRRLVCCRRVGRARPRTAQNPAERLRNDEDDMDVEDDGAADVAGPLRPPQ